MERPAPEEAPEVSKGVDFQLRLGRQRPDSNQPHTDNNIELVPQKTRRKGKAYLNK
jgi:hypothetical protein